MILYFSGTGNSEYVAELLARKLGDSCEHLFTRLRDGDVSEIESQKPYVVVAPTYAWQLPRILRDWLRRAKLTGNQNVYFVMTCGDSMGNAGGHAEKLCNEMGMNFCGCAEVIMPENYIAMFTAPGEDESREIIDDARPVIMDIAKNIAEGSDISNKKAGPVGKLESGLVNACYYPLLVHANKFYATDNCTACGKCARGCVLNNISIESGKPKWADNCTHCMACICGCPVEAIEYGNRSHGKVRYKCPAE